LGIALPLLPQLGFGVTTALLAGTFLMAIHVRVVRHHPSTAGLPGR